MPRKINTDVDSANLFKRIDSLIARYDFGCKGKEKVDVKLEVALGDMEAVAKSNKKPNSQIDSAKNPLKLTDGLGLLHIHYAKAMARFNRTEFDPGTYRDLSSSDKTLAWLMFLLMLLCVMSALIYRDILHQQEGSAAIALYQDPLPKMVSDIASMNKLLATQKKSLDASILLINKTKDEFYSPKIVEGSIDDITRLFEVGNLIITKQDIRFQSTPNQTAGSPIPSVQPVGENTLFSEKSPPVASVKQDANSPVKSTSIPPTVTHVAKKVEAVNKLNVDVPPELSFLSIQLNLRGRYLDYLLARNALTRIIPSASIPSEEIFVSMGKPEVEIRMILDIPFIKQ